MRQQEKTFPLRMLEYRLRNGRKCLHCENGKSGPVECLACAGTGIKVLSFDSAARNAGFSRSSWQGWEEEAKTPTPVYQRALHTFLAADERKHQRAAATE